MIKCLVFDEAHRAKGNHAYCEVIRKLSPKNKLFRVLALSATPGNSSRDVLEVMRNLLIAHLEFRSEESPDVKPYVFERVLETVVVPLGDKLQQVKDQYMQVVVFAQK
jgi:ERCC4-related helicase